ncbi:MAG: AAA family ATPase, partial [Candidatus Binataceae bacterium]
VVGPNGCGKSNVADAIRWVLGEQAPTRLRGKSSDDLIHAGNDSNPPAGMAEVTLLLEAEDRAALPEPYAALSEVAVTRRIYRLGDSDYLINKLPCRLKDITEFFMAAQIHSRGYALIEQGRVEEIIQAKPNELRAMVEEAAGLALFKGRREMSERKLERVKENLARVDDVLSEIERQLNYARRQAKKAEAYKVIRAELFELERLYAARRLLEQHHELSAQSVRELDLTERRGSARTAVAAAQNAAETATAALNVQHDELAAARRELETLRTALDERVRTRAFLQRRLDSIAEVQPGLEARLIELGTRATASRAARAEAGARLARAINVDDGVSEAALATLRDRHREAERALRDAEKRVERMKDEVSEVIREAAVLRGRLADLSGERADLEAKLKNQGGELPQLTAAIEQGRTNLAAADATLASTRDELHHCEESRREAGEREIEARSAAEYHRGDVAAAKDALALAQARAERILPDGAGERLRSVLDSLNGNRPAVDPTMLLEVIKAPAALEPALRAVLGDELDAVIVDSPHFALQAIDVLKDKQAGRLCFIPESVTADNIHESIDAPGILGRLLDMVEVEPRYHALAEAVIGHVMLADNLHAALDASHLNGRGTVFVTREGDVMHPGRMMRGGSAPSGLDDITAGAFEIALNPDAAANKLADVEAIHDQLVRTHEQARNAHREARETLDATRASVQRAERAAIEVRGALPKMEQRLALAEASCANARRRLEELAGLVSSSNARLEELARLEADARARLNENAALVAERKRAVTQLADVMMEAGAKMAARKA